MLSNPLIDQCVSLTHQGYNESKTFSLQTYSTKTFEALGRFLLGRNVVRKPKPKDLVICFGAGMDSYIAMFLPVTNTYDRVRVLHCDYGSPYFKQEREVFRKVMLGTDVFEQDQKRFAERWSVSFSQRTWICQSVEAVVPVGMDLSWENYIVPARNLLLAAVAANYGDRVWVVANSRNDETVGARDKTKQFYTQASRICSEFYQRNITVESPVITMSKMDMVRSHLDAGYSIDALANTFSCYNPNQETNEPCGVCYSCYKKFKILQKLNYSFNFAQHPQDGKNWATYEAQEKAKRG